MIEENQRYLRLEHEDKESYVSYFTVNAIVGELDFPSSEIFYFQQQQFTFPVDTSMNVEIVAVKFLMTFMWSIVVKVQRSRQFGIRKIYKYIAVSYTHLDVYKRQM